MPYTSDRHANAKSETDKCDGNLSVETGKYDSVRVKTLRLSSAPADAGAFL